MQVYECILFLKTVVYVFGRNERRSGVCLTLLLLVANLANTK